MFQTRSLALYAISLVVFLGIDFVWLSVMGDRFYRRHLGDLMAERANLPVALVFYLLYVVGVLVLVVLPAVDKGSLTAAIVGGALLGAVAYGTYDFTNLSTLAGWPTIVAVVDVVWGTTLTAVVSTAGYFAARWLG
jgi:uncharacterized membrane protein